MGSLRGHEIYFVKQECFYKDSGGPTAGNPRSCGYCKLPDRKDGHDACLGVLTGVANACCGHGKPNESYIQFDNGTTIRGFTEIDEK